MFTKILIANRGEIACRVILTVWILGLAAVAAMAQTLDPPTPGSVWFEEVFGQPERAGTHTGRGLRSITNDPHFYRFENGEYKSVLSRIRMKLPRIGSEGQVTVREATPYRRADGDIATAHLVILPGAMSAGLLSDNQAMSAVVVTRLRDDRPKDRNSVLSQWEPANEEQREQFRRAGIEIGRINVPKWGESVQRVVLNRASVEPFPYRLNILRSGQTETVGVSRFLLAGEDSLLEFSQIVPCAGRLLEDCKAEALVSSDRFIAGVTEFLTLPAPKKD